MPRKSNTRSSNSSHASPMKGSPHPQRRDKRYMSVETASESDDNDNEDGDDDRMNSTAYASATDTSSTHFDTMDSFNASGISAVGSPRRTRRNISPMSAEKQSPRRRTDRGGHTDYSRVPEESDYRKGRCTSGVITQQVDTMKRGVWILCLLVLLFIGGILVWWLSDANSPVFKDQFEKRFDEFNSDLSLLTAEFTSQDRNMWRIFHAATRQVLLNDNPAYPAVILLASMPSSGPTSACLTQKILKAFTNRVSGEASAEVIDVTQFQNALPDEQKLRLDKYLNKIFDSKKIRAASIANLNKLHPEAGMLLHSFADNENANFKNVLLILQFHVPRAEYLQSGQKVEDYLQETWAKDLGADKISGLMSRIANNIAIVKEETSIISNC